MRGGRRRKLLCLFENHSAHKLPFCTLFFIIHASEFSNPLDLKFMRAYFYVFASPSASMALSVSAFSYTIPYFCILKIAFPSHHRPFSAPFLLRVRFLYLMRYIYTFAYRDSLYLSRGLVRCRILGIIFFLFVCVV